MCFFLFLSIPLVISLGLSCSHLGILSNVKKCSLKPLLSTVHYVPIRCWSYQIGNKSTWRSFKCGIIFGLVSFLNELLNRCFQNPVFWPEHLCLHIEGAGAQQYATTRLSSHKKHKVPFSCVLEFFDLIKTFLCWYV